MNEGSSSIKIKRKSKLRRLKYLSDILQILQNGAEFHDRIIQTSESQMCYLNKNFIAKLTSSIRIEAFNFSRMKTISPTTRSSQFFLFLENKNVHFSDFDNAQHFFLLYKKLFLYFIYTL